ncbi:MAG TPA: M20/M25/M40 family metallo-hydrolase [Thermoanaerobaculia bacterium]|nr:M20/M25/M40 family metallo-hydrolase [Thermoanaerobaculia bacterium]
MRRTSESPLVRRQRLAARIALYTSCVLAGLAAWGLVRALDRPLKSLASDRWIQMDYPNRPEVKLLRDYVRIDTTDTTGSEVDGARFLARQLAAAGIPAQLEILDDKHANVYAELEGADPHPLVLHNHIDVSAVDPKEWFFPPFEGHIEIPWIYGRGVFDMKSVAIAQLLSMIDLKQSGKPLERSVLFLATSSEERGSRLGVRRIIELHPDMVRNFWAVLTEGGAVEARSREDIKYWGTEFGQKRFVDVTLCGSDRQQLEDLHQLLVDRIDRGYPDPEVPVRVTPEVRAYLASYGPSRDRKDFREMLANPDATILDPESFRKLPDYVRSLFRPEAVPFPVAAAPGGGFEMVVKLHLLPGQELPEVMGGLLPRWLTWGLTTAVDESPSARHGSPLDHPVFVEIQKALEERYPSVPKGPWFLPWTATDSRFFRAMGVPSYGFSPFLIMNTDTLQVDRANERFALPGFVEGVGLYKDVVRRLVL